MIIISYRFWDDLNKLQDTHHLPYQKLLDFFQTTKYNKSITTVTVLVNEKYNLKFCVWFNDPKSESMFRLEYSEYIDET